MLETLYGSGMTCSLLCIVTLQEDDGGPHSDPEPTATPSPQPAQPRPGLIATIIVFITSFFSSLLPQQIPELQAN